MVREIEFKAPAGLLTLIALIGAILGSGCSVIYGARTDQPVFAVVGLLLGAIFATGLAGIFVVNPNEGKVITLFGKYVGTEKRAGLWFANPFTQRKRISLRVRNFETAKLKVNDANSNPIEIGAIIVWKVVETAEATFEVDNYEQFVQVQSEAALRTAGVEVIEARISHLAYAPEIAAAMLRRQQASAIIAARAQIVEGAVGMVEHALELLSKKAIIVLDEERKAQMVSNLLVVLCSDHDAQPVVNTGSIHQ